MEVQLPNIPDEIILRYILSQLPAKSLLRFRCICKRWCGWISDPQFKFWSERRRILVLPKVEKKFRHSDYIPWIDQEDGSVKRISFPWRKEELPASGRGRLLFRLLGSCNGFLLASLGSSVFLWNPSTRATVEVFKYKNLALCYDDHVMSALCYDSSTDDYKVVIGLMEHVQIYDYVCDRLTPIKFCSLQKKCWAQVELGYVVPATRDCGPVLNGNQHWLALKWNEINERYEKTVIYFDGNCDKFSEVPFPEQYKEYAKVGGGLGELDGCLALALCDEVGGIELWVMKDYGVKESWTSFFKCLDSPFRSVQLYPLCITKVGEVLMVKNLKEIVAYSPQKKLVKSIIMKDGIGVASYVETLVSPAKTQRGRKQRELDGKI
ncbi:hypothetical protein LguiA_001708 [Lonicera macranthoides]